MKWMNRFFGQQRNTENSNQPAGLYNNPGPMDGVDLDSLGKLFVDPEPPAEEEKQAEPHAGGRRIQAFLDQDFHQRGYSDGYQYHVQDILDNRLKRIKADFRLQLDQSIDQKRRELLKLKTNAIEVEGLSERVMKRIEALSDDFHAMIARLELEKELSVSDEGWVMSAVHAYRDGFIRGLEAYNELAIFGQGSGLFH